MRRAELASRSAAERAAVAAIHEDRRGPLALLELEALPLLRGIADGTLDPADPAVRRKCAEHASDAAPGPGATGPDQAGGVLAGLEPVLGAARARDMAVEVQVVGDPGSPAREVARATLAAVHGWCAALPPQPVTLTVLSAGDEVELYLTFGWPAGLGPLWTWLAAGPPGARPAAAWRASLDAERPAGRAAWRSAGGRRPGDRTGRRAAGHRRGRRG